MQIEIIEKQVETILRPTGINLAPYVINPYQGCALACVFCYAQFSKAAHKEIRPWGKYVKVKINALEILKKELKIKAPEKVLIGSTTEPFQPVEKQYGLTRGIIRMLNKQKIKYVIMSRSMLLEEYAGVLDKQLCDSIYFTVDTMPEIIKHDLEPYAVEAEQSIGLVNRLNVQGIKAVAYFCPIMPFLQKALNKLSQLNPGIKAEFEIVNFQMSGIREVIKAIGLVSTEIAEKYKKMCVDWAFYASVIKDIESDIKQISKTRFGDIKIHAHVYNEYFKNIY